MLTRGWDIGAELGDGRSLTQLVADCGNKETQGSRATKRRPGGRLSNEAGARIPRNTQSEIEHHAGRMELQ